MAYLKNKCNDPGPVLPGALTRSKTGMVRNWARVWIHDRNRSLKITRHELNITNCISDGKLSLDVFGVFLCQIIDQIYAFPGITETRILKQFDYVCPRTSLLDFLARLELTGIIIKQRVKYQEPRLVSKIFLIFVKFRECNLFFGGNLWNLLKSNSIFFKW